MATFAKETDLVRTRAFLDSVGIKYTECVCEASENFRKRYGLSGPNAISISIEDRDESLPWYGYSLFNYEFTFDAISAKMVAHGAWE